MIQLMLFLTRQAIGQIWSFHAWPKISCLTLSQHNSSLKPTAITSMCDSANPLEFPLEELEPPKYRVVIGTDRKPDAVGFLETGHPTTR